MKSDKQNASVQKLRAEALVGAKELKALRGAERRAAEALRATRKQAKEARRAQKEAKSAAKETKKAVRRAEGVLEKIESRLVRTQAKRSRAGKKAKTKTVRKSPVKTPRSK
jgi:hypothetical protein